MSSPETSPSASSPAAARRRKWLAGTGAALGVLLVLALVVPAFLDWNEYKPQIQEAVKSATGRDLFIDGEIGIRLLPRPALIVSGIRFANAPEAHEPDMVRMKALDVRVALLPLFVGQIAVSSVVLDEPFVRLEKFVDGRTNWQFAPAAPKAAEPSTPAPGAGPGAGGFPAGMSVNRLVVDGGTLIYVDHTSGSTIRMDNIDLEVEARSLKGPFTVEGEARYGGAAFQLEAEAGALEEGEPIPFSLGFHTGGKEVALALRGSVSEPSPEGRIEGAFNLESRRPAEALALVMAEGDHTLPGMLGEPLSLTANLRGTAKAFSAEDLVLAFGALTAKGRLDATLGESPRADLRLAAERVNLDSMLAAKPIQVRGRVAPAPSQSSAASKRTGSLVGSAKAAPSALAGRFSLPEGFAGSAEITVGEVAYRRKAIRDLHVAAALEAGGLALRELSASLPGQATFGMDGRLSPQDGQPVFTGQVHISARKPRELVEWLGVDASAFPQDTLNHLSYESGLRYTPGRIDVGDIRFALDDTRAVGGVAVALGERLGLGVSLQVGKLDLDRYFPPAADAPKAKGTGAMAATKPASPPDREVKGAINPLAPLAALNAFDLNLRTTVVALTINRIPMEGIDVDLSSVGGALDVRRLHADNVAGARVDLAFKARDFTETPKLDGRFDVATKDLGATLAALRGEAPAIARQMGPVSLKGKTVGTFDKLKVEAAFGAVGGTTTVSGELAPFASKPGVDLITSMDYPEVARVVRLFMPTYEPQGGNLGPLALTALVRLDSASAQVSDLKGRIGTVALNGEMAAALAEPRPSITVRLAASEIPLDAFLPAKKAGTAKSAPTKASPTRVGSAPGTGASGPPWSIEPLDLSALRAFDADITLNAAAIKYGALRATKPTVVLKLKDGVATLTRLGGELFGGKVDLTGHVDARAVPKIVTNLKIENAEIREALRTAGSFDLAAGKLTLDLGLTSQGSSQAALVSALNGTGSFGVLNGRMNGFDLDRISAQLDQLDNAAAFATLFQTALAGGSTPFRDLRGTLKVENGVVRSNDIKLTANAGSAAASGAVDLGRYTVDAGVRFVLAKKPDLPFGMRLSGPLNNPKRSFDFKEIQAFYVKKGAEKLLEKVLPREKAPESDAGPAPSGQGAATPHTPRDVFEGILKGLGR